MDVLVFKMRVECIIKHRGHNTKGIAENKFRKKHKSTNINQRQRLVLNKLLDGFEGKLPSSKWAKMEKCSTDRALRDIKDLIEKELLRQERGGGRNTNDELTDI